MTPTPAFAARVSHFRALQRRARRQARAAQWPAPSLFALALLALAAAEVAGVVLATMRWWP